MMTVIIYNLRQKRFSFTYVRKETFVMKLFKTY